MTISDTFEILGGALLAVAIVSIGSGRRAPGALFCAAANLALVVSDIAARDWAAAAVSSAAAAWIGWNWWRRNRRRAPRSLGAKARARLAALVKTMKESLKPWPALRPVPGGVR
jgi:1,6-anhydro-N-acetylmuramate kinase